MDQSSIVYDGYATETISSDIQREETTRRNLQTKLEMSAWFAHYVDHETECDFASRLQLETIADDSRRNIANISMCL